MIGFRMPTHVLVEPGAVTRLPEAARSLAMQSCLLVVDPGLRQNTEWLEIVQRALEDTGIRTRVFDDLQPNPRTTTVTLASEVLREAQLDGVVALGGGSAIDAGKAAAMLAENELRIEQYEGKNRYANPPRPFVAIPTTCGTGSEVTWVSVLSHEPTGSKMSVKGDSMFPNQALVDADMLQTLPPNLVAWTGMDATDPRRRGGDLRRRQRGLRQPGPRRLVADVSLPGARRRMTSRATSWRGRA